MKNLQGLRLNCWLAAMLPAVLCALLLLWLGKSIERQHLRLYAQGAEQALAAFALGGGGALTRLAGDDQRWHGAAHLSLNEDGVVAVLEEHGQFVQRPTMTTPELTLAVTGEQSWPLAEGRLAVAVPIHDNEGAFSHLLYGEVEQPVLAHHTWVALISSLIIAVGALLAWYLARRIYAPVEDLAYQAEAALHGRRLLSRAGSAETASIATAISSLADAYVERAHSSDQQPPEAPSTPAPPGGSTAP